MHCVRRVLLTRIIIYTYIIIVVLLMITIRIVGCQTASAAETDVPRVSTPPGRHRLAG